MSRSPLVGAYAGFGLLGAAVLGAFVYDRLHGSTPTPAASHVTTPGPVAATAEGAPRVPAQRPDFTLRDLAGRPHRLAEWSGRPLLVNFWATWCAPCRREIPLLNRLQRSYGAERLQVVGIAVDFADDVRAFVRQTPLSYPLLVGEEDGLEAARAFGVEAMAFPFTAVVDASGRVLLVHLGELHENQAAAILATVADVDAHRLAPGAAPAAIRRALAALPPAAGETAKPLPIEPVKR